MLEFQDLVKDFVEMKSIKTHFTDNKPGYDWVQSFLKRHKLSFKKGGHVACQKECYIQSICCVLILQNIGKGDTAIGHQRQT